MEVGNHPGLLPHYVAKAEAMSRFSRQTQIAGWKQADLSSANVVLAGVGALGNEVARLLAMSGVGRITLCDPDNVDESNLHRTVLFNEGDIGRPKVYAAADALSRLAPGTQIVARPLRHAHGVGLADLRDADLVISCLDSRVARVHLSGRCGLVGAPLLDGGTNDWGGEVRSFMETEGACYACTLGPGGRAVPDEPVSCLRQSLPEPVQGAHVSVSSVVGGWMGVVALRWLMRLSSPSGITVLDASRGISRFVESERDRTCPLHERLSVFRKLQIGISAPLTVLRALVAPGTPVLWEAVPASALCLRCGHCQSAWVGAEWQRCMQCGGGTELQLSVDTENAPGELTLRDLQIPPREILPVRTVREIQYYELT
jgi:molybdopterin/thiamine biosynthesis adenylyltransferase